MPNQGLFDAALQKINKRLQEKIVTLEAEHFSANNKIAALESDLKRRVRSVGRPTLMYIYRLLQYRHFKSSLLCNSATRCNANEAGNTKRFASGIYSPVGEAAHQAALKGFGFDRDDDFVRDGVSA